MSDKMRVFISLLGGVFGYLFGGLDALLEVFAIILIIDTATGMFKHYVLGTYESKKFRQGFVKKSGYMLALILAVQLDRIMGDSGALRSALLFCFIANESASIVENLGEIGVPIPPILSKGIAILKDKAEPDSKPDSNSIQG